MARKSVSPLQTAVSLLTSVKADMGVLRGRTVVKVDDKMDIKKMPIAQFLTAVKDLKPIFVQRNDLYRLNNGLAKHLDTLELPQTIFALVYFEGVLYLVDGNTRKRAWSNSIYRELPSHVWVAVMVADSKEQAKRIYQCIDSKRQGKTSRDELISLLHEAGIEPETLASKLVAGGKLVTVVSLVARTMSGGSASPQRKQQMVNDHRDAFLRLDELKLDEGVIPAGAVWALLRLYREVPKEFHGYVTNYAEDLAKLKTDKEHLAASSVLTARDKAIRACYERKVGTTGDPCIPVMFPHYLVGFLRYAKQRIRQGTASESFKKFVSTRLEGLIDFDVVRVEEMLAKKAAKAHH